jgi:anti-sigma regulatory factor (Ser/Thr protein kinase)
MTPTPTPHETYAPGGAIAARRDQLRSGASLHRALLPRMRDRARMSRLRLHLSATAEEVPFARAAITRLCEHLEIDEKLTERVRLAVTEACTNCVRHAYGELEESATYVLDARADKRALLVTVCDHGLGIQPGQPNNPGGLGLGLDLIDQVADNLDVSSRPRGGTRVAMRFALPAGSTLRPAVPA